MIWYLPIEPLEERYTKDWYVQFPREFENAGYECTVIDGNQISRNIKTGEFLDVNATLSYKASQLEKIGELFYNGIIKSGDIFFIADLEFWGIESIRYLSVLNKIPVKIFGFLHAGSYDEEDFYAPCSPFARDFEEGWINICDKVFVGSEYHKALICKKRIIDQDKIVVSGNPFFVEDVREKVKPNIQKQNKIIHSNLPDWRKRPNIFLNFVPIIKEARPDVEIVLTTSRNSWGKGWISESALVLERLGLLKIKKGLTKAEYYQELAESKVMFSATEQETFGYCIVEAMAFNTNPVVPNRLSCPEIVNYNAKLLYNDYTEALEKIFERLSNPVKDLDEGVKVYEKSIKNMIKYF